MTSRAWAGKSLQIRSTLDTRLQKLVDRLLVEVADITLLYGYRDKATQDALYAAGRSKLQWPDSKHNSLPSMAVDFVTYPVNLKSTKLREELAYVAGAASAIARQEGFKIRWGGDWNLDGDLEDNTFDDLFHIEIKE